MKSNTCQKCMPFGRCWLLSVTMLTGTYGSVAEIQGPRSGRLLFSPAVVVSSQTASGEFPDDVGQTGEAGALPNPEWFDGRAGGMKIALLRVASPGALAHRLYFADVRLSRAARMFIYGVDSSGGITSVHGPYEGNGPLNGDPFRSRIIVGNTAVIELQSPEVTEWLSRIEAVNRIGAAQLEDLQRANHPGLTPAQPVYKRRVAYPCFVDRRERQCELRGDAVILEGDIRVEDLAAPRDKSGTQRRHAFTQNFAGSWPNGKITYVVNRSLRNADGSKDERLHWAIRRWNAAIPNVLVEPTSEPNYVEFRAWDRDYFQSSLGCRGGVQYIEISEDSGRGTVAHEIGHALGVRHEHTRFDRDNYVRVLWENIPEDWEDQYEIPPSGELILSYDYNSIMHCGGYLYNKLTIQTIPPGISIGQRSYLSANDAAGATMVQCNAIFSQSPLLVPAEGGNYRVNVALPSYCSWTASSSNFWVTLSSPAQGKGSTQIPISVAPNHAVHRRTAYVRVGRNQLAVLQGAAI